MKTVTYEEFLEFDPCWLCKEGGAERIEAYFDRFGGKMSALDILNLADVSAEDKLWSVLREEFIPAPILHEFACICAECALTLIDNPDPRSIKAIEIKRAWMRGEATDEERADAYDDACDAAWNAARAAWDAARDAARDAGVCAARAAARAAASAASDAAWDAVYEAQVAYLIMTLEEEAANECKI